MALGANVGEPLAALRSAARALAELGEVIGLSSIYRTAPVGGPPEQPDYLNAVIVLRPDREHAAPAALMAALHRIERDHGRVRRERWGPRVLDLDLLDVGGRRRTGGRPVLPHPRMMERAFVLAPLCEVAPHWRHPGTGVRACDALATLDRSGIVRTALGWDKR